MLHAIVIASLWRVWLTACVLFFDFVFANGEQAAYVPYEPSFHPSAWSDRRVVGKSSNLLDAINIISSYPHHHEAEYAHDLRFLTF
ncbi:hypothetical protein KCU93_g499, partial [Aureobasidium melanogenum]